MYADMLKRKLLVPQTDQNIQKSVTTTAKSRPGGKSEYNDKKCANSQNLLSLDTSEKGNCCTSKIHKTRPVKHHKV